MACSSNRLVNIAFDTDPPGGTFPLGPRPNGDPENPWKILDAKHGATGFLLPELRKGRRVKVTVTIELGSAARMPFVEARAACGPHSLAVIPKTPAVPTGVDGHHCTATIFLSAADLVGHCEAHYLVWDWRWSHDEDAETYRLGQSEHLLFVIPGKPTAPWAGDEPSSALRPKPWLAPLMVACGWANGARTPEEATTRIIRTMFALSESRPRPRLKYDGNSKFYIIGMAHPVYFACERFLDDVISESTIALSCRETTAVTASLSNLLGSSLSPMQIARTKGALRINSIWTLAGTPADPKLKSFSEHCVAGANCREREMSSTAIFDAALRVDADNRPAEPGHEWTMPIAMPLGDCTSVPGRNHYLPQLVADSDLSNAEATCLEPFLIRKPEFQYRVLPHTLQRYRFYLDRLEDVRPNPAPAGPTAFNIHGFTRDTQLTPTPPIARKDLPPMPPYRTTYYEDVVPGSGRRLIAMFWTDDDEEVTRSVMAELLTTADQPPVLSSSQFGPTYESADGLTAFVLLNGAAAQLSSIGPTPAPVHNLLLQASHT